MPVFLSKRDFQRPELVSISAVQSHAFAQRIEDKIALGNRKRCFFIHDCGGELDPSGVSKADFLLEI